MHRKSPQTRTPHGLQYCFRLEWPEKYAPSSGNVLELGFETQEQAAQWHVLFARQIDQAPNTHSRRVIGGTLALRKSLSTSGGSHHTQGVEKRGPGLLVTSFGPRVAPLDSFDSLPTPLGSPCDSSPASRQLSRHPSLQALPSHALTKAGPSDACSDAGGLASPLASPLGPAGAAEGSGGRCMASHALFRTSLPHTRSAPPALVKLDQVVGAEGGAVFSGSSSMRWVPYKHTNGMALYYHHSPQMEGGVNTSGEYMISTTINVSGMEGLRGSNTTLGLPATRGG